MSWIMTAEGWRMLSPKCENRVMRRQTWNPQEKAYEDDPSGDYRVVEVLPGLPSAAKERNGYEGKFPSLDCVTYINSLKEKLKYFDDGERLVYGKTSRVVEVDNFEPIHPIPEMPEGFRYGLRPVETNQLLNRGGA